MKKFLAILMAAAMMLTPVSYTHLDVYKRQNLHCVVLTGMSRRTCTLADPLKGVHTVERAAFLASFAAVGSRAVVIH